MRRARFVNGTLGALLAGWVGSAGCTHNYYYGAVPAACAPGTTTLVPGTASICDLPTQLFGGGTVVASSPGIKSSVTTTAPPSSSSSDVVVSEPINRPRLSGVWRRPDPESSVATTRVEGALNSDNDSTVK
jgi:hypothetical protein